MGSATGRRRERRPFWHLEAYGASVLGCRLGRPPAPPSGHLRLPTTGRRREGRLFWHVEAACDASVLGCRLGGPPAPPSGPCALVRDGAAPRMTSALACRGGLCQWCLRAWMPPRSRS